VNYDWRNLPSQLIGNAVTVQYAYDGDGQRTKKKNVGGTELHYVRGADGSTLALYKDDDLVSQNIWAAGEMIGTYGGSQRRYFLKDHLGSIRTTVSESGAVVGYDDYYPFGLTMPGRSSNTGNPNDDYKFTGHELDDEAGLDIYYMIARGYDPVIGRFLQVDPLANEFAGWSPYGYTFNNPLKFTDPTGMAPEDSGCEPFCYDIMENRENLLNGEISRDQLVDQAILEGGSTITALGVVFAPISTGVSIIFESVFSSDNPNIGGASTRATIFESVSKLVPSKYKLTGKVGGAIIGELLGGTADRAISGEQILNPAEIGTDILAGGLGGYGSNLIVRSDATSTGLKRFITSGSKRIIKTASKSGVTSSGLNALINKVRDWFSDD
jgi:RHS repeat-associated protein